MRRSILVAATAALMISSISFVTPALAIDLDAVRAAQASAPAPVAGSRQQLFRDAMRECGAAWRTVRQQNPDIRGSAAWNSYRSQCLTERGLGRGSRTASATPAAPRAN